MSISRFQQRPIKLPVSRPATSKSYKDAVNEREIFLDLKTRPSSERSQTNDSNIEQKPEVSSTEPALQVFSPVTQQAIEKQHKVADQVENYFQSRPNPQHEIGKIYQIRRDLHFRHSSKAVPGS